MADRVIRHESRLELGAGLPPGQLTRGELGRALAEALGLNNAESAEVAAACYVYTLLQHPTFQEPSPIRGILVRGVRLALRLLKR